MWHASLRTRLILIVVLAIVPALLLALGTGLRQRAMLVDHATGIASRLASDVAEDEWLHIMNARLLLASLANNPVILNPEPAVCDGLLTRIVATDSSYTNLAVVTPTGELACTAIPGGGRTGANARPYFQRAVAAGQFALAEHGVGGLSGKVNLPTGYPVYDASGSLRLVLHAGIDLSWIGQLAKEVKLPPGSHAALIMRDGTVLDRFPDGPAWRGTAINADSPLAVRIQAGEQHGIGTMVDIDGVPTIYAFRALGGDEDSYGQDDEDEEDAAPPTEALSADASGQDPSTAYIVVTVPTSAAMAEADRSMQQNLLALAVVALLAIAAAWFGGDAFLLRRVRSLVATAERLAEGDLGARAKQVGDSGELGRLADAFDRMAESLQRRNLEREDASLALAASEARYRAIVEEQTEWIVRYQPDLTITFANDAYCRHLARPREALIGTNLSTIMVSEPGQFMQRLAELSPTAPSHFAEVSAACPNGSLRWEHWTDRAIFDPSGRVLEYQSVGNDVTARRQAEAGRQESDRQYRSLVENVKEVIFRTDADGRWTLLNPAWTEITGFPIETGLGQPVLDYLHPNDRERGRILFEQMMQGRLPECREELRCLHVQDGFRWIEVYARLVLDGDDIVGTTGTLMDITDRRLATDALLRQDRLLSAVAGATNQLLTSSSFASAVGEALATLGNAVGVDRVRIFQNMDLPEVGAPVVDLRHEWSVERTPERHFVDEDHERARVSLLRRWCTELAAGRPIRRLARALPTLEREVVEGWGMRSVMAVPITIEDNFWGFVGFDDCHTDRIWTDSEVSILAAMAGSIGGAIARQQSEQAMREAQRAAERESERLLALHRASTALGSASADQGQVVAEILRNATDLLDADGALLYQWDSTIERLRCVRSWHMLDGLPVPDIAVGSGIIGQTFQLSQAVLVDNYPAWEYAGPSGKRAGIQTALGVPLRHGGRTLGVLLVASCHLDAKPFTDDAVRVADLFADQAAAALENARLYLSLERRLERLRTLAHLAQLISSSLDMADVLREVPLSAARLMDAPASAFWVADEQERMLRVSALSDPDAAENFPFATLPFGEGAIGWAAETRQAIHIPNIFEDSRFVYHDWWREHGLLSLYAVPVVHDQQLLAVLTLYGREPFSFDAEDRDLLEIFVAQIATAFRNASLFEAVGQTNRALETSVARANDLAEVARAASRAKSEFLSRMSHELRTPMNAILGFAQLLDLNDERGEHQESTEHILKAGQHLLGLINEVLDISRIESGHLPLSIEPVDAYAVSNEVVDLVRSLAQERRVSVSVDRPHGTSTWIMADHQRVKQIITNLLTNGVKYNRPGGSVTITYTAQAGYLRIAVRDTGVGIEPDKIGRLFDPFDRLDADVSGIEGTGLGLTISRSLAEAMGGSLTVESVVGQGSTFTLNLPVTEAPPDAVEPADVADVAAPAGLATSRHAVLYIEDNAANRVLVQRIVEWRPSVDLVSATDGKTGLALARECRPCLVFLDLHLPDISGRDVLEALRADPRTADVPVVILSADASPGQIQRLLDSGAHSYLTKPIVVRELLDTLDTILEPGGVSRAG
jgi:PAS domain S-box-containing protein